MANSYLQVRTNEEDKIKASAILEELGTNLSAVVNMLLKQIIITKSIPFEIKLGRAYSNEEILTEVQATMAMEGMPLTDEDIVMLKKAQGVSKEERDKLVKSIIEEYSEA